MVKLKSSRMSERRTLIWIIVVLSFILIGGIFAFIEILKNNENSSLQEKDIIATLVASAQVTFSPENNMNTPTIIAATENPTVTMLSESASVFPATTATPFLYEVQSGDTISTIAMKFHISSQTIMDANHLTSELIYAGDKLVIPGGNTSTSSVSNSSNELGKYTVKTGDTIDTIAAAYQVDPKVLRNVNYLMGDTILVGQNLNLPQATDSSKTLNWSYSAIGDSRGVSYPMRYTADQFTLKYENYTIISVDPQIVANLVVNALNNAETLFGKPLSGSFTAYAAGTLFSPPELYLKGESYSKNREFIFLYDGSGDAADQQYIVAHEFTHLYMWNTYGVPSSVMVSEGSAVYSGMNAISGAGHLPLMNMCKLLYDAKSLPNVATGLSYNGHNYDQANYFTAGCFVEYLAETYGIQSVGEVYSSGAYQSVFGKSLTALEKDFESYLINYPVASGVSADDFALTMKKISLTFQKFFPSFSFTDANIEEYLLIDQARVELLKGNVSGSNADLEQYNQLRNGS